MRASLRVAAVAAAGLLALAGCSSSTTVNTSTGPTATATPALGSALSAADFAAAIKLPNTVLIDVRTPSEFASGHLPGATNLDLNGGAFAAQVASLDKSKTYALYCHSGNRSGQALSLMKAAGFTSVYHLNGGITAWTNAGGNTTT